MGIRTFNISTVAQALKDAAPYELDDDDLVLNRLSAFQLDFDWREQCKVDFDRCVELYEARSGDTDEGGIPRRNKIKKVIDDHHAVAVQNIPSVSMKADRAVGETANFLANFVYEQVTAITERQLDQYVKTILSNTNFPDELDVSIKHASLFGVGHVLVDLDQTNDTRYSRKLRALLQKPLAEWTETDAAEYAFLNKRISARSVDTRNVFWQSGVPRVGQDMMRVSHVEIKQTSVLRRMYGRNDIYPGVMPHKFASIGNDKMNTTAILTTWEISPYQLEKSLMEGDNEVMKVTAWDWVLTKTVVAGGALLEKKVYSTEPSNEEIGWVRNSIRLPIIPIYLRESENHPYGDSMALRLELSEEWLNRMYFILYKAARKAVSNQGVLVNVAQLGEGDLAKINHVLDEGGVAGIVGRDFQGDPDLNKIVMPLNYMQSQLPQAMMEAVRLEEEGYKTHSDVIDIEAINRARSGTAKRAQVAVADRPKTISRNLMSRALEDIYDSVYELVSIHHTDRIAVPVAIPGAGRQVIYLNEHLVRVLPEFDAQGNPVFSEEHVSPLNPAGIVLREYDFVINDVATTLKAVADGRGELPGDMISRLQILSAMQSAGQILPETARHFTLPEDMRAIDDGYRKLQAQAMAKMQQMQQQQVQQEGGYPALEQAGGLSPMIQDSANDIGSGVAELSQENEL